MTGEGEKKRGKRLESCVDKVENDSDGGPTTTQI